VTAVQLTSLIFLFCLYRKTAGKDNYYFKISIRDSCCVHTKL